MMKERLVLTDADRKSVKGTVRGKKIHSPSRATLSSEKGSPFSPAPPHAALSPRVLLMVLATLTLPGTKQRVQQPSFPTLPLPSRSSTPLHYTPLSPSEQCPPFITTLNMSCPHFTLLPAPAMQAPCLPPVPSSLHLLRTLPPTPLV